MTRSGDAAALRYTDVSANSDFSDPKFWISGRVVGHRVKPTYRHEFRTLFQAFWEKKFFLLYQSLFLPNGTTLFLSNDFAKIGLQSIPKSGLAAVLYKSVFWEDL